MTFAYTLYICNNDEVIRKNDQLGENKNINSVLIPNLVKCT